MTQSSEVTLTEKNPIRNIVVCKIPKEIREPREIHGIWL